MNLPFGDGPWTLLTGMFCVSVAARCLCFLRGNNSSLERRGSPTSLNTASYARPRDKPEWEGSEPKHRSSAQSADAKQRSRLNPHKGGQYFAERVSPTDPRHPMLRREVALHGAYPVPLALRFILMQSDRAPRDPRRMKKSTAEHAICGRNHAQNPV